MHLRSLLLSNVAKEVLAWQFGVGSVSQDIFVLVEKDVLIEMKK